jgi:GTP-binding protein
VGEIAPGRTKTFKLGGNKAGRDGIDIIVRVPVGTIIKDSQTGETLVEFTEKDVDFVVAQGGRGGKGNSHFATSTNQAPKFAQPGEEGESRKLHLELKLLADVGIIGFPNAGKSTLISRVSAAKPKIADYPFTTRVPNLGVVALGEDSGEYDSAVFADIPGLVEGAHRGLGLGHQFLRHIERTKVFIHVLDAGQYLELTEDEAKTEIVRQYEAIRQELGLFKPELLEKPEVVVLNKIDLIPPKVAKAAAKALERATTIEPLLVSCATGSGLRELLQQVRELLPQDTDAPVSLPDASAIRHLTSS